MSEYTPTTDEIVAGKVHLGDNYWRELTEDDIRRGLAEHDRQVAERAWGEGYMDGRLDERTHIEIFDADPHHAPNRANPYRAAKGEQK